MAWLRTVRRLPVRVIRTYLPSLQQLDLSVGAIVAVLPTVAAAGQATVPTIKAELQAGDGLYMDETGWDENGQGGYSWVLTNAAGGSYYHYDHSRAGAVARGLRGAHYQGPLITDFYAAYNDHAGRHQRCWGHLLRDLAGFAEQPGGDGAGAHGSQRYASCTGGGGGCRSRLRRRARRSANSWPGSYASAGMS
jgi:hypothetical protein